MASLSQGIQDKLAQVKAEFVSSTSSSHPSDEQILSKLEESDGNVEQTLKVLREGSTPTSTTTSAPPLSIPAPTTPTNTTPTTPTPPTPPSPLASELHSMFPTLSISVIQMIVETHSPPAPGGYNPEGRELSEDEVLDRCIGDLLIISDPEFKPEPTPSNDLNQAAHVSLDEQFARSLALQEQQQQQGTHQNAGYQPNQGQGGLPYQPRVRKTPVARYEGRTGDAYGQTGGEGYQTGGYNQTGGRQDAGVQSGVGEQLEERFEKFAEAGKKTFDSLFNKAKSKYNEFQETQAQRQAQQQQQQGQTTSPGYPSTGPRGGTSSTVGQGAGGIAGTLGGLWSGAQGLVKEATAGIGGGGGGSGQGQGGSQSQQGYAQAERQGSWNQQRSGMGAHTAAPKVETKRWSPTDVYDDEPSHRADVYGPPSSTNSSFSIPSPPRPSTTLPSTTDAQPYDTGGPSKGLAVPGSARGSTTGLGTSPTGTAGTSPGSGKIDTSKLGMLPKKKVSLLSSSPGNTGVTGNASSASTLAAIPSPSSKTNVKTSGKEDDDVEEEFTQSPFDE